MLHSMKNIARLPESQILSSNVFYPNTKCITNFIPQVLVMVSSPTFMITLLRAVVMPGLLIF